jgi:hypothetical protein
LFIVENRNVLDAAPTIGRRILALTVDNKQQQQQQQQNNDDMNDIDDNDDDDDDETLHYVSFVASGSAPMLLTGSWSRMAAKPLPFLKQAVGMYSIVCLCLFVCFRRIANRFISLVALALNFNADVSSLVILCSDTRFHLWDVETNSLSQWSQQ